MSRDVTEILNKELKIRENEKRLKELNTTKDKLFSIITHDLRNPFNALIQMNELVSYQLDNKDYASAKELMFLIEKSSKQALNLLDNLLQWSRIQSGTLKLNLKTIQFGNVFKETKALLENNFTHKKQSLQLVKGSRVEFAADEIMLKSILNNLISNARKFTPVDGKIQVSAEEKEEFIHIQVKDSGVGIPAEKIDSLFNLGNNASTYGTENEKELV